MTNVVVVNVVESFEFCNCGAGKLITARDPDTGYEYCHGCLPRHRWVTRGKWASLDDKSVEEQVEDFLGWD